MHGLAARGLIIKTHLLPKQFPIIFPGPVIKIESFKTIGDVSSKCDIGPWDKSTVTYVQTLATERLWFGDLTNVFHE